MQGAIKLDRSFGSGSSIHVGRDDLIYADFVLKCGADRIGRHIQNLVPGPDDAPALAFRKEIAISAESGIWQAYIETVKSCTALFVNDMKNARIWLSRLRLRLRLSAAANGYDLHV